MSGILNFAWDNLKNTLDSSLQHKNVSKTERVLSVVAGGFIFAKGIKSLVKHPLRAVSELSIGGALVYRGVSGYCPVKQVIETEEPEATIIEHRYFVK